MIVLLKLVVVPAVLLYLLFRLLGTAEATAEVVPGLLAAGVVLAQVAQWLYAERMRATLAAFAIPLSRGTAFRIYLQSMCYFFVVPMSVGMEISQVAKIKARMPQVELASLASAVLADRVVALASAAIVGFAAGAVLGVAIFEAASGFVIVSLGAAAILVIVALLFAVIPAARVHARKALKVLTSQRQALARPLALGVLMQCALGLATCLVAAGIGAALAPIAVGFAVAMATIAMVVPASFAGVGTADLAGFGALLLVGADQNEALLVAAAAYSLRVVAGVQGALWEVWEGGLHAAGKLGQPGPPT